jgi:large repetitive protein
VFTPAANANGAGYASFTFQVRDDGGTLNAGVDLDPTPNTITIDVTPVNDPPVANNDVAAVQEDVTLAAAGDVLANDTDVDAGDTKTVTLVNGAAGNVAAPVAGSYGSVTIGANGSYTYSLNNAAAIVQALAAGQTVTDTFTYQVADSVGATATATLTVTITGTNDAPVANADAAAVQEDVTLAAAGDVLANDTDVDAGDTKTVTLVNGAAGNVAAPVAGSYGSVTIGANGSYTYSLNNAAAIVQALAAGQTVTDTFTYQVTDSTGATATATLTVTITGTNDVPVNTVPVAQTPAEDTPYAVAGVSVNDADAEPLTVTVSVANGTLTVNLASGAMVTGGANGTGTVTLAGTQAQLNAALASLNYQGVRDYNGADTLTITTVDAAGASDTDSIAITVTPVNDDPVLGTVIFTIDDGRTLTVTGANLNASDVDDAAGSLVFTVSGVTHGYFALVSNPGVAITSFTQADIAASLVQFKHDGSSLAPAFQVLVADPSGGSAGPVAATIMFNVGGAPLGGAAPSPPPAAPTPIEPIAASTAATVLPASPRATAFTRAPTEPPIDGGGDSEENAVAPPPSASASSLEKRMVAEIQFAGVRADTDAVESKPLRSEIEVEPVRAEMQVIPTRHNLELDEEERSRVEVVLNSVRITGLAFSVGAVWWAARAAGLMASLLASSPAWRHVDPLPVLGRDEEDEDEYEVVEEDKDRKDEEHRAAWVLEDRG